MTEHTRKNCCIVKRAGRKAYAKDKLTGYEYLSYGKRESMGMKRNLEKPNIMETEVYFR